MKTIDGVKKIVFAALVIVSLAGTGATADGLVAEWRFDGNAQDSSGNGNHGAIYGATFVQGISGQALKFDGIDDYVKTDTNFDTDFQDVTIEVWVKILGPLSDYQAILAKTDGSGMPADAIMLIRWADGSVSANIQTGSDPAGYISFGTPNVDAWHHLVIRRFANTGLQETYLDGALISSVYKAMGTVNNQARYLTFGRLGNYDGKYFNGIIDEVRIYNRAISASEVKANYNALISTQTPTPTPTLTPTPAPAPGNIIVDYTPSGTIIYLDGVYRGVAPKTITNVSAGFHYIELNLEGYKPLSLSIYVKAGSNTGVSMLIDITPPSISISKQIVDFNKNDQLDEGEKLVITYGASDDSGVVKSIKLLLDGNLIELRNNQNNTGIYSVTTDALSMGDHLIVVEATDPEEKKKSEEMKINVKRAGPSVYPQKLRYEANEGEDINVILAAVNPIGNPSMNAQIVMKPPSTGVSVYETDCKNNAGICTSKFEVKPGDNVRTISVRMRADRAGEYKIDTEIYYQYETGQRSPPRYETLTLVVKSTPQSTGQGPMAMNPIQKSISGFGFIIGIMALVFVAILKRRL